MCILIKGGRVIDPYHCDQPADILVADGRIVAIGPPEKVRHRFESSKIQHPVARIIDADGYVVCPGLVDMHVHLREPGQEHKETIDSGSRAAVRGGFTAVCCMPNTSPVNDNRRITDFIRQKAARCAKARVYPVAAVTRGLRGKELSDFEALKSAGAIAVSDDGMPVMDAALMRRALKSARRFGLRVISHCEDLNLAGRGVMNAGGLAESLGRAGISNASESNMVRRDIALAEECGAAVHIAHVSTAESVQAIREGKARGVGVTAETAPHYFSLTEAAVIEYQTHAKMNPPLRTEADRRAVCEGLADGTIDAIATDHAPHAPFEKQTVFEKAPNGVIGLESSLSISLRLLEEGILSWPELVAKMTTGPAGILGLRSGIRVGYPADVTVIDPGLCHTIDASRFCSLSRNCPFDGWQVKGKAVMTIVAGKVVYQDECFR
jgi:dihydroorotase